MYLTYPSQTLSLRSSCTHYCRAPSARHPKWKRVFSWATSKAWALRTAGRKRKQDETPLQINFLKAMLLLARSVKKTCHMTCSLDALQLDVRQIRLIGLI